MLPPGSNPGPSAVEGRRGATIPAPTRIAPQITSLATTIHKVTSRPTVSGLVDIESSTGVMAIPMTMHAMPLPIAHRAPLGLAAGLVVRVGDAGTTGSFLRRASYAARGAGSRQRGVGARERLEALARLGVTRRAIGVQRLRLGAERGGDLVGRRVGLDAEEPVQVALPHGARARRLGHEPHSAHPAVPRTYAGDPLRSGACSPSRHGSK